MTILLPNKTPEPTPSGALCSAIAGHVADVAWLSLFRSAGIWTLEQFHLHHYGVAVRARESANKRRGIP